MRHKVSTIKGVRDRRRRRRDMFIGNFERLKYESVHCLTARSFIPTAIGIVNEEPYI